MSISIFFMKFSNGNEESIPFSDVKNFLSRYGDVGKGISELEVVFPPEEIGELCSVVCDEHGDIACISIDRPIFGDCFRKFSFDVMREFGLVFLEGGLQDIYLLDSLSSDIPASILSEAECVPIVITKFEDIYPAD